MLGGLRIENSSNIINDTTNIVNLQFLPTFNILLNINDTNSIRFSYDRSLTRPGIWSLNPFIAYSDSLSYSQGNPYLKPSVENNWELNYTYKKDKLYISATAYYFSAKDIEDNIIYVEDNNVRREIPENVTKNIAYGLKLSSSFTIFNFIKLNPFINIYYDIYEYNNIKNGGIANDIGLSGIIDLPKGFYASFYTTPIRKKQYSTLGHKTISPQLDQINVGKNIFKGAGQIDLFLFRPFPEVQKSYINGNNYKFEQLIKLKVPFGGISYSY